MIIPVNIAISGDSDRKLPPHFAQFGTDEVVLVELQGTLEVDGEMKDQFVGKLGVDAETVSDQLDLHIFPVIITRLPHCRKNLHCS